MKKLNIITCVALAVLLLASCAPETTLQKDIKHMTIRFKPLTRTDVTLVGNLEAEVTISGGYTKKGKTLDAKYSANYKKGLINKSEATEIMYFAPGNGEAITGSLYENEVFNSVFASMNVTTGTLGKGGFGIFKRLKGVKLVTAADPGMDFGYYALVEKYPDVDYFINVRFERKNVIKGKKYTETVIVKADGVKLKTDN